MESSKQKLILRVQQAIDTVRPHLKLDGGDVEILDISPEMHVTLRWVGNCESCSMSRMTIAGIEHIIKSQVPEIQGVEAITANSTVVR